MLLDTARSAGELAAQIDTLSQANGLVDAGVKGGATLVGGTLYLNNGDSVSLPALSPADTATFLTTLQTILQGSSGTLKTALDQL